MSTLRREWPLVLSALFFSVVMVIDYATGFMSNVTSLTSGRQSDLFVSAGMLTVITLAFLEGILGIDNATVLAIQVRHLKPADAHRALTWGIWGAFLFRFVFLLAAGFILEQKWIMALGGFYLIDMAADFFLHRLLQLFVDVAVLALLLSIFLFSQESIGLGGAKIPVWYFFVLGIIYVCYRYLVDRQEGDAEPGEEKYDRKTFRFVKHPLVAAIIAVEWTDILFSFDSIGAGVALTRDFWVLFWGAFFGVTCLRLFAKSFIRLLEKYPQLEGAAMIAVLIVGLKMAFEAIQDTLRWHAWHIQNWQTSLLVMIVFVAAFFVRARPQNED